MRRLFLAFLVWIASVAPVAAFDPSQAARDAIAQSGGPEFLEVVEGDADLARVRHRESGLSCVWGERDSASVKVQAVPRGQLGDDFICSVRTMFGEHTLYATRWRSQPPPTLDQEFEMTRGHIVSRFPRLQEAPGLASSDLMDQDLNRFVFANAPPRRTVVYIVTREDGSRFDTRLSLIQVNGWSIKMRYSGPMGTGHSRGDAVWLLAATDVLKHAGLLPPPPAGD